jgi:hypothetical protein
MMVVDWAAAAEGRRRKISPLPLLGQGFEPNKIQTPARKGRLMAEGAEGNGREWRVTPLCAND